mgnify:CR=1 FL=1
MKKLAWLWISIGYLFLCCLDGALTYYHSPDLSMEGNPLVANLGFGWMALFIANALGLLLFVLTLRITCTYSLPIVQAKNWIEWDAKIFYGEYAKKIWLLYKLPKNWKVLFHAFGFAYAPAAIAARLILIMEWAVPHWPAWYSALRHRLPLHRCDVTAAILVLLIFLVLWICLFYHRNQRVALKIVNS